MMRYAATGLGALTCGLIVVVAWETGALAPSERVTPVAPHPTAVVAQPVAAPNHEGEWLATILARPMFSPDRRPPSEATAAASDHVPENLPRLSGVLVGPFGRSAIFAIEGARPVVVGEGGRVNAWTVRVIQADAVELEGPGGARTVHPSFQSSPPAADGQAPIGQRIGLSLKQ